MKTSSLPVGKIIGSLLFAVFYLSAPLQIQGARVAFWGDAKGVAGTNFSSLSNVTAIVGGAGFSLALNADGTVIALGEHDARNENVFVLSSSVSNAIAISAGSNHALALNHNGRVIAWGYGIFGETNVPANLSNVIAVAAGSSHSLALRADGRVVGWGSNFGNQATPPAGLDNVKAIAASVGSIALRQNGTVVMWGSGSLNVPAGLNNVRAVAAGGNFYLALKADGTVVAWGNNSDGQTNVPPGATNVIAISAGFAHAVALRADGIAIAWGQNLLGQTNIPVGLTNLFAVSAGGNHNLVLTHEARVQLLQQPQTLGVPYTSNATFSVLAIGEEPLKYQWYRGENLLGDGTRYSGANSATFAISNAQFSDAGIYRVVVSNAFGAVTSSNATLTVISPPFITSQSPDRIAGAGTNVTLSVGANGTAPLSYQWSFNGTNLAEKTSSVLTLTNVQPENSGAYLLRVTNVYGSTQAVINLTVTNTAPYILLQPSNQTSFPGGAASFVVSARGSLPLNYQWQFEGVNIPGATNTSLSFSNLAYAQSGFYTVIISNPFGVTNSSKAFLNVSQVFVLEDKLTSNTNTPIDLTNVTAIAAGGYQVMALTAERTVKVWLVTSGFPLLTNVPASATNVTAIAAGSLHCLALRSNGTVVAWGQDSAAQVIPSGLSNIVGIAAGPSRSFAIKSDGSVVGWGTQGIVPTGLSNVIAISARSSPNVALKRDGTVVTWSSGSNLINSSGVSNVIAVSAGPLGFVALRQDGTVWPSSGRVLLPGNLSNVVAVVANSSSAYVLRNDGSTTLPGTLGSALTNVSAMDVGGTQLDFRVVLLGNGAPAITLQPYSQIVSKGDVVQLHSRAVGLQPMSYQWQLGNINLPGATNSTLIFTNMEGKYMGSYRMLASNSVGSKFSESAYLTIPFSTNLPAALSATNLIWDSFSSTSKTVNVWFAQIRETHDGDVAAQSGGISHNQLSQLNATVVGPGTLTFWWKVSSEAGYDFLKFSLDNETVPRASISGEAGWEKKTVIIPSGFHILRWTYLKDGTVSSGRDAGWVDEVVFTPFIIIARQLNPLQFSSNGVFISSDESSSEAFLPGNLAAFEIQASTNVKDWITLPITPVLTNGSLMFHDTNSQNFPMRFYRIVEH